MPLYSIMTFKHMGFKVEPYIITQNHNVSSFSFWTRGTVKEFLRFGSRTVVSRTQAGNRQSVLQENEAAFENSVVVHARVRPDGLAAAVITDVNYPGRVAFNLIEKALSEVEEALPEWEDVATDQALEIPALADQLALFDNPADADDITRIQSDLDETQENMLVAIDKLLERGERIEELVQRSSDLSATSRTFAKQSKKLNKCSCTIL
ncbi:Ykt6 [Thecamonas trahens ATCC 50062]|uniref:Ykt6 n=1 Tax=Thecamonas trahens ATCC 50062 TaxID=461836 RepID=A0A0L0DH11_THETB|nr:Ykt6 [Thecamonas trahens ATCC 50062]KNC51426.1 Ykt6 [Thecamonas trahens ATCC 50062]|eukprot:XP_013756090.1 Ykt6 [Thecamonas trahens ATCC 50062]